MKTSCAYIMLHFIRTKDKKVNYLFVHLNLCIALALGLVVFISGIETAVNNEVISYIDNIVVDITTNAECA